MGRWPSLALALILLASGARADPFTRPAITLSVTVGVTSAQASAAHGRNYLALLNQSNTATIACAFAQAAVLNGAGSITLLPNAGYVFDTLVPQDAINCIASASAPLTIIE